MDIQTLAQQAVAFLAPFLPYLLKAGEKAAKEAGKEFGADAWERARTLWGRLRPKIEAKPAAQEAAGDVAANPQDADAQAALRLQLKKMLTEDETLARQVQRVLKNKAVQQVIASGERAVAIGGSVSGSTIITGDDHVTQQGKYNVQIGRASGLAIGDQAQVRQQKGIVLIPVESSMIHAVGYNEQARHLEVVFTSGRVYCYEDVPPDEFEGLLQADSKGRYMRANIIDMYPYRRGPCPK